MEKTNCKYKYELMILGAEKSGKSSILSMLCTKLITSYIATLKLSFFQKFFDITDNEENCKLKLKIWDTSGQKKYEYLHQDLYRFIEIFIIVYDMSNNDSLESINYYYDKIGMNKKVILIGNKKDKYDDYINNKEDLVNLVDQNTLKNIINEFSPVLHFQINTIDGKSVQSCFLDICAYLKNNCSNSQID